MAKNRHFAAAELRRTGWANKSLGSAAASYVGNFRPHVSSPTDRAQLVASGSNLVE
jgi:hypothetical protein